MREDQTSHQGPSPALIEALGRILRPIMRLAIRHGLTLQALLELIKTCYVESAEAALDEAGEEASDSRISVLTGVHRKDVRRLRREAVRGTSRLPAKQSTAAQAIALWLGDARYCDAAGRPLALPRAGRAPSFESLVTEISTDIRPRTMFDDWLARGFIAVDEEDNVTLLQDALIPSDDLNEMAHFLGRNIGDHLDAARSNMQGDAAPFLERAAYFDRLTQTSIDALHQMAREKGNEALMEVNRAAHELAEQDEGKAGANKRFRFGLYFYSEADHGREAEDD